MARSMITGRETQKMQEYTQERIAQAERRGIEFPTDVKEQLFEYGNLRSWCNFLEETVKLGLW